MEQLTASCKSVVIAVALLHGKLSIQVHEYLVLIEGWQSVLACALMWAWLCGIMDVM